MVNAANLAILARASAKFELGLANLQGSDLVFQRRGRNLKPGGSSGRPGDTASACGQRCLNDLPLTPRLALQRLRRCNSRQSPETIRWRPNIVDGEHITWTQNHRPFDDILQLANIARPIVRLQALQRPFFDCADAFSGFLGVAKYSTNVKMSSLRSRRGGISMGDTLRR